eukprot:13611099-Alexandrium_andersonii.AAC.1
MDGHASSTTSALPGLDASERAVWAWRRNGPTPVPPDPGAAAAARAPGSSAHALRSGQRFAAGGG